MCTLLLLSFAIFFSALLLAGSRGSSRSNRTGRREGQYRKYQVVNCINNFIVVTKKVWIRDWLAGLISAPRLLLPPSNMRNVLRYWHSCCDVSVEIAKTGIHTDSTVLMVNRSEKRAFLPFYAKGLGHAISLRTEFFQLYTYRHQIAVELC